MKFLIILNQNFPILSVFITLLLRSYEGKSQPGEMKADSCLKYSTPLCYTTRWALTREALLSSYYSDSVVGPFPNVCWPSKEQTSMQKSCTWKHNKNHAFDNVLAISLWDFDHINFPICYSVFLQLFFILLIVMATLYEMLCFLCA